MGKTPTKTFRQGHGTLRSEMSFPTGLDMLHVHNSQTSSWALQSLRSALLKQRLQNENGVHIVKITSTQCLQRCLTPYSRRDHSISRDSLIVWSTVIV